MSTAMTLLGSALVLSPFMAVTALMVRDAGWREAAIIWGIVIVVVAPIIVGSCLISMGAR